MTFSVFSLLPAQFESCDTLKVNRYCFTLYDERNFSDTIPVSYVWNFGDGIVKIGKEVIIVSPDLENIRSC